MARFILCRASKTSGGDVGIEYVSIDEQVSLLVDLSGGGRSLVALETLGRADAIAAISHIFIHRNPDSFMPTSPARHNLTHRRRRS